MSQEDIAKLQEIKKRAARRKVLMNEKLYGEWNNDQLNELREINQLQPDDIAWLLRWVKHT